MPTTNAAGRRLYTDTRTLPWNATVFVMIPTDATGGQIVIDSAQDVLSERALQFDTSPDPTAGPEFALIRYSSERLPSAFRSAPGPTWGAFGPAGSA